VSWEELSSQRLRVPMRQRELIGIHAIGSIMIAGDERGAVNAMHGLGAASSSTFKELGTHGYAVDPNTRITLIHSGRSVACSLLPFRPVLLGVLYLDMRRTCIMRLASSQQG
jgi:hypothetical protein